MAEWRAGFKSIKIPIDRGALRDQRLKSVPRPIAVRPGEGRFTQPTAGAQPQRQEPVFMPLFRPSYRSNGRSPSIYRPPTARFIDVFVGQTFFGQRYGSYPDIDAEAKTIKDECHLGRLLVNAPAAGANSF
jgi:hypothetical protein